MAELAKCPACSGDLPWEFGIQECPSCGVVVDINLEGVPSLAGDAAEAPAIHSPSYLSSEAAEIPSQSYDDQKNGASDEAASLASFFESEEALSAHRPDEGSGSETENEFAIADMGAIAMRDGSLVYELSIEGIDSIELRNRVLEVLSDKKLEMDPLAIRQTLRAGRLILKHLNPIQTAILVGQLKSLPLSIRWEQHELGENISPLQEQSARPTSASEGEDGESAL